MAQAPLVAGGKGGRVCPVRGPAVLSYLTLGLCVLQVREERLAEENIKKRVAARKMEEAEARHRQEEEARRRRAVQQVRVWAWGIRLPWALGIYPRDDSLQCNDGDLTNKGFVALSPGACSCQVSNSCLALQEEEERRRRELMQKKREEEQERARKIAEQRQAEREREKQLAAERELERKREQERIQAEK